MRKFSSVKSAGGGGSADASGANVASSSQHQSLLGVSVSGNSPVATNAVLVTHNDEHGAAVTKKEKATKRRQTFGGSRLSLHSLLFPSSYHKEKQKLSLSTNDLQESILLPPSEGAVGDSATVCADDTASLHTAAYVKVKMKECPLCAVRQPATAFPRLSCCHHRSCHSCLVKYLQMEIQESRVLMTCPECCELLHPNDVRRLLADHPRLVDKYEQFSLRRCLMGDPDTRWCPAPDCG